MISPSFVIIKDFESWLSLFFFFHNEQPLLQWGVACWQGWSSRTLRSGLPLILASRSVLFTTILKTTNPFRETSKLTIQTILSFWNKPRILTRRADKYEENLEKFWTAYQSLEKSLSRKGNLEEMNKALFKNDLQKLFNIVLYTKRLCRSWPTRRTKHFSSCRGRT